MKKTLQSTIAFLILLPSVILANDMSTPTNSLEIAYQREFAFLDQQKISLENQITEFLKKNTKNDSLLQNKLNRLKNSSINLDIKIDKLRSMLTKSTLSLETKKEDQNRLSDLFHQASTSLNTKFNNNLSLIDLFRAALRKMKNSSKISFEKGDYFLPDGKKVSGTLINIGTIASYAVGNLGTGMLVPAGDGKLKLWKPEKSETAMALSKHEPINTLDIFLYEDKNISIKEAEPKSIPDIVESGGVIAWIIVVTGGIAIIMIFLRLFFLNRASKGTDKLMLEIKYLVRDGKIENAIDVCDTQKGAAARVVTSTLRNLDRERDHLEDIVAESILHEHGYLNRYGSAIIVIAAVAPLMGLLGTVTGMIETFDIITKFGTGDPKLLSVGISTALVTTQLGLIVAIPALVAGNLLSGWSNKIKDNMEQAALGVINLHGLQQLPHTAFDRTINA